ncbi:hypothetical protein [Streptomyces griseorubiginosus]|uniref:hypothetical protein n=1 Tax=Streptomyces griseorubiginosus TaxID=67304 RepID=UPI00364A3851
MRPAPWSDPVEPAAFPAHDEVWHGTAADTCCELQVQAHRKDPLPDDRWRRRAGR